ncbi:KAR3 [[Candida] subhashii]|uniref:KAR3 n=1 Tax=[Candida] subhashii TaxID=561895 RepID=A0A8J5UF20_9ASCO|nr:KAR3 [[Candida] subhashii]KAG7661668.1 KAR3 [[Candida] subhashii]
MDSDGFNQLVTQKEDEIRHLKGEMSTLKSKIAKQELENFRIEQECHEKKREVSHIQDRIEQLDYQKQASLTEIEDRYKRGVEVARFKHQQKISDLRDCIAKEAQDIISEKQQQYEDRIQELMTSIDESKTNILEKENQIKRQRLEMEESYTLKFNQENQAILNSIEHLNQEKASIKQEISNSLVNVEKTNQEIVETQQDGLRFARVHDQLKSKYQGQSQEIDILQGKIQDKESQIEAIEENAKIREEDLKEINFGIKRMGSELVDQEYQRRVLHARLQDLKGNIRVFCRIRSVDSDLPLAPMETPDDELDDESKQELIVSKTPRQSLYGNSVTQVPSDSYYKFSFDKIFTTKVGNVEIFEELSQLIQTSLDGQNVCVFAYGQTGSGKTFTMSHPEDGMIPLSIKKIFDDIDELSQSGFTYKVTGQFLEIYNETIVDLLSSNNLKCEIKHDDEACITTVTNSTLIEIKSPLEATKLLEFANKKRSTASTMANERSSRSHSIFTMIIEGKNEKAKTSTRGILNLIDLAGSERLNVSKAEGERLKETQNINRSLSSLGDVIYSLGLQQQHRDTQHIPFRNSKLTYLLKHSLGGNSKTLMFVNISPLEKDLNETINSLRFAAKVNGTKLQNQPKNQVR